MKIDYLEKILKKNKMKILKKLKILNQVMYIIV